MSSDALNAAFLESIQPIVLVGGRSRRFGRDKLREPIGASGSPLVLHSIEILRSIFGRRVKVVGECHPDVPLLADGIIIDAHPAIGPLGGITSALQCWRGSIFVLAGDMPSFSADSALRILAAAQANPQAFAVFAATDRTHPCAGLSTQAALPTLAARIAAGHYQLSSALVRETIVEVTCDASSLANINEVHDVDATC